MSRRLEDLHPQVQAKARDWLDACARAGLDILVTQTFRSHAEQERLYAQGRTAPGAKVTNARGGDSFHQYGVAIDFVPMRNGKPVWGTRAAEDWALWEKAGSLAEEFGFEWAHRWKTFRESAHIQYTGGLKLADFKAGRVLA
jgi:peptidoglycan L-alanyl-D-glutamate endopeptidase CwlK